MKLHPLVFANAVEGGPPPCFSMILPHVRGAATHGMRDPAATKLRPLVFANAVGGGPPPCFSMILPHVRGNPRHV